MTSNKIQSNQLDASIPTNDAVNTLIQESIPITAGLGINYFLGDTNIIAFSSENNFAIKTLTTTPIITTSEVEKNVSITLSTSPKIMEAYRTNAAIDRTFWQANSWVLNLYAHAIASVGDNQISVNVYNVASSINFAGITFSTTDGSAVDQSSIDYDGFAVDDPAWQSFTAGITGWMTSVDISNESGVTPTVTVSIYSGTGTGGTLLGSNAGVNPIPVGITNVTFSPSIHIIEDQVYTIAVTATSLAFWWTVKTVGTYIGGSYMGTAKDAVFNTYVTELSSTERACTASDVIFNSLMANADPRLCWYIETPKGAFPITAYANNKNVTIETSIDYVSELNVSANLWGKSFEMLTGSLDESLNLRSSIYPQNSSAVNANDYIGIILFATTDNVTSTTIGYTHNGKEHYSFFQTSLAIKHNNTAEIPTTSPTEPNGHVSAGSQTFYGEKTFAILPILPLGGHYINGFIEGFMISYNSTTNAYITSGFCEANGKFYQLASNLDHTMTSLTTVAGFRYIYIDDSASTPPTPTIIDNVTAPSWSDAKFGWYNGDDRCVGSIYNPSGSAIVTPMSMIALSPKVIKCMIAPSISMASNINPDGTWQTPNVSDGSVVTPVNAIEIHLTDAYNTSSDVANFCVTNAEMATLSSNIITNYIRLKGSLYMWFAGNVPLGASRNIKIAAENLEENTLTCSCSGFTYTR